MTMKFAPHVRHVVDQQRDVIEATREYAAYEAGLKRLGEWLGMEVPVIPPEEYAEMRNLLAARHGVPLP
jgi:hypothetical protein